MMMMMQENLHRSNLDFLQDSKLSVQPSFESPNKTSRDPEESLPSSSFTHIHVFSSPVNGRAGACPGWMDILPKTCTEGY